MTLQPPPPDAGMLPWEPDPGASPPPDHGVEPDGFVVLEEGVRIHFLDWGGPSDAPGVLLVPGLLQPAWSWTPVARRLRSVRRVVVADLRGQGLSDSPPGGYDPAQLARDVLAVAEGAELPLSPGLVLGGHGFGAMVATEAATLLADDCGGLVLVDGGWERLEATTGLEVDEFLRGLDEPPEVMRSMPAFLEDRRDFDPATWDADQERAARDAVVETGAGKVVRAVRPHVVEAIVRSMFAWEPGDVLPRVEAPVAVLVAMAGSDPTRLDELRRTGAARASAGRSALRVAAYGSDAHNLMRYRPDAVAAALLSVPGLG
jgi:pimeloyl-ACP methyl ester carboxylesterase